MAAKLEQLKKVFMMLEKESADLAACSHSLQAKHAQIAPLMAMPSKQGGAKAEYDYETFPSLSLKQKLECLSMEMLNQVELSEYD